MALLVAFVSLSPMSWFIYSAIALADICWEQTLVSTVSFFSPMPLSHVLPFLSPCLRLLFNVLTSCQSKTAFQDLSPLLPQYTFFMLFPWDVPCFCPCYFCTIVFPTPAVCSFIFFPAAALISVPIRFPCGSMPRSELDTLSPGK